MKLHIIAPALALTAAGCVQVEDPGALLGASGLDRNVAITNDTKSNMTAFYGSHRETDSWEENILGDTSLAPGKGIIVDFKQDHNACIYDFRGEFADGGIFEDTAINVCKISEYSFTRTKN